MTPKAMYNYLRQSNANTSCDPFDGHVLACIFSAAVGECNAGGSFTDALGIYGSSLRRNVDRYFPGTLERLEDFELDVEPVVAEDERCVRELLWRFRTSAITFEFTAVPFWLRADPRAPITFGRILDSRTEMSCRD